MTLESLSNGLQFTETNSFAGVKERHEVLSHLGFVLQNRKDYFGRDIQRPGNLMGMKKSKMMCLIACNDLYCLSDRLSTEPSNNHQNKKGPIDQH